MLDDWRVATGASLPDLSQGLLRLVTATGSVTKGLKDLRLAQDVAVARNTSLAQTAVILARAEGGSDTALRRLGIIIPKVTSNVDALKKKHDEAVAAGAKFTASQKLIYNNSLANAAALDKEATRTNIISELQRRFAGQTSTYAQSAAGQWARFRQTLELVEEEIGRALLPSLSKVAESLRSWLDELRTSSSFHAQLHEALGVLGAGFEAVGNAIDAAEPALRVFYNTAKAAASFAGAGGILALAAGYKAAAIAITTGERVQARYLATVKGSSAAETESATALAGATDSQVAYTAAVVRNTAALEAQIATLRLQTAAAASSSTAVAGIATSTAATTAAAAGLGASSAQVAKTAGATTVALEEEAAAAGATAILFSRLGTAAQGAAGGLASFIGWQTAALAGAAALAFGIYKLVTQTTDWERANEELIGSLKRLADATSALHDTEKRLGDLRVEVPVLKDAVATARLALERDKAALANSRYAQSSQKYREQQQQVISDQDNLAAALHSYRSALNDLRSTEGRRAQQTAEQHAAAQVAIQDQLEQERLQRSLITSQVATARASALQAGKTIADQVAIGARYTATAKAVEQFVTATENSSAAAQAQNPQLANNIRLLGQYAESIQNIPSEKVTRLILNLPPGVRSVAELFQLLNVDQGHGDIGRGFAQDVSAGLKDASDNAKKTAKSTTDAVTHTADEAAAAIAKHMTAYGATIHDSVTSAADDVRTAQNDLADTMLAGVQAISDSITSAKQNLNSLGQTLAEAINNYLDKIKGKTGGTAKVSQAIADEAKKLREEIASGNATPEEQRRAKELQSMLEARAAKSSDTTALDKEKDRVKTSLANITDLYNKGAITRQQFEKRITRLLKEEGVTRQKILKAEGVAAADAYTAALAGVSAQAKALRAPGAPQAAGTGLEATIVSPLDALNQTLKDNRDAEKRLADARNALTKAEIEEQKKLTAELKKFRGELLAKGFTKAQVQAGGKAVGGPVHGPAGIDRVPAMLTPGEIVLNQRQQQNLRGMLGVSGGGPEQLFHHVASGGNRFAGGGVVGFQDGGTAGFHHRGDNTPLYRSVTSAERDGRALIRAYEAHPNAASTFGPKFNWHNLGLLLQYSTGIDPGVVRQRLRGNFDALGPGGRPLHPGEVLGGNIAGGALNAEAQEWIRGGMALRRLAGNAEGRVAARLTADQLTEEYQRLGRTRAEARNEANRELRIRENIAKVNIKGGSIRDLAEREIARQKNTRGSFLPPGAETVGGFTRLYRELEGRAREGLPFGQHWYPDSGQSLRAYAGGNEALLDKLASVTAILSPRRAVSPNLGLALQAINDYTLTKQITVGNKSWQRDALKLAMEGKDWRSVLKSAPKVKAFYGNLLKYADRSLMRRRGYTGNEVTGDGWYGAAFHYRAANVAEDEALNTGKVTINPERFAFMQRVTEHLANEFSVEPDAIQAGIWTSIKAELDQHLSAGYAKGGTNREQVLRRASASFADAIGAPQHTLRFNVEAASSAKPWLKYLTPKELKNYTRRAGQGTVAALQQRGVPVKLSSLRRGMYRNEQGGIEMNPQFALELAVGTIPGGTRAGAYAPGTAQQKFASALAGTIAREFKQEGVGTLRRFPARAERDQTAWDFNIGRQLTSRELRKLGSELHDEEFYYTPTDRGFIIARTDPEGTLALPGREREAAQHAARVHLQSIVDDTLGKGTYASLIHDERLFGFANQGGGVGGGFHTGAAAHSLRTPGAPGLLRNFGNDLRLQVTALDSEFKRIARENAHKQGVKNPGFAAGGVAGLGLQGGGAVGFHHRDDTPLYRNFSRADKLARQLIDAYKEHPYAPVKQFGPKFNWHNLGRLLTLTTGVDPGIVRQRLRGNFAALGPGGRALRPGEVVGGTALGGRLGAEADDWLRGGSKILEYMNGAGQAPKLRPLRPGVTVLPRNAEGVFDFETNFPSNSNPFVNRSPGLYFPDRGAVVMGHPNWIHSNIAEAMQWRFRLPRRMQFDPAEPFNNDWIDNLFGAAKQLELWERGGIEGGSLALDLPPHWTLPGRVQETPELIRLLQHYANYAVMGSKTYPPVKKASGGVIPGFAHGGVTTGGTSPRIPLGIVNIPHVTSAIDHVGARDYRWRDNAHSRVPLRRDIASWAEEHIGSGVSRATSNAAVKWWREMWPAPRGFMSGGLVPGNGMADSVPAMLSPGEIVVSRTQRGRLESGSEIAARQRDRMLRESKQQTDLLRKIETNQRRGDPAVAALSGEMRKHKGARRVGVEKDMAAELASIGVTY